MKAKPRSTQWPAELYHAEFASGFRAVLTFSPAGMSCEWTPDIPRPAPAGLLDSYREWRDMCLGDYASRYRINILCVDLA